MKLYKKLMAASALLVCAAFASCDDYLTLLPTDQITEDQYWQTKDDLDNVRAAAYAQLAKGSCLNKIMLWGELRSDNVVVNDLTKTDLTYLQGAVLQPQSGMYDWSAFYTGINYCNSVIEHGDAMTVPGQETDPTFRIGNWKPIRAEMVSLRALYYFYLVRAFRNVPYVAKTISTDTQAKAAKQPATSGAQILTYLIKDLEDVCDEQSAATNYGSTTENHGRFTKRSVHALLADMYLWRGCMLKNALAKGDSVIYVPKAESEDTLTTQAQFDRLSASSFEKAQSHVDEALTYLQADYDKAQQLVTRPIVSKFQIEEFPYMTTFPSSTTYDNSARDVVFQDIWAQGNSDESLMELQMDGENLKNPCGDYFGSMGSSFGPGSMTCAPAMVQSCASAPDPAKGWGRFDIRLNQTVQYEDVSATNYPIIKMALRGLTHTNISNMSETSTTRPDYYPSSSNTCNWPLYRLTDLLLIKAEAIARSCKPADKAQGNEALTKAFYLMNVVFHRNNPGLEEFKDTPSNQYYVQRYDLTKNSDYCNTRTANELLVALYAERQREFVGEGKRWFDIVRQAEAQATSAEAKDIDLAAFITFTSTVKNRLRSLWAFYNPIYSEELKVNGVEFGGGLVQNPVWDRYTKK